MHPSGLIALVYGCPDPGQSYEGRAANVSLVAAAPDLLALARQYASECCECAGTGRVHVGAEYVDHGEFGLEEVPVDDRCPDCIEIRSVIAKAAP